MGRLIPWVLFLLIFSPASPGKAAEKEKDELEATRKEVENRGRTEILSFFFGPPQDASGLKAPLAIELYNQAVEFYQKREYELAREAAEDSLEYDPKNPLTHELLGDIAYYQQKLDEAEQHYQAAFRLKTREDLKEKLLKVRKEGQLESRLATYQGENFIIKYRGDEFGLAGFELRESLRAAYRAVGQDFGYFFRHKVPVLLYDEAEFRELSGAPHWSTGVYDGKIRLPAYQKGFTRKEIEKIMRHEVTHAFVVEMSRGRCPAWLNEGLAEYEEAKIAPPELQVFKAAVRSNTLFPLVQLFAEEELFGIDDPLEVQLFYEQSYQVVKYLVERYGMFRVKKLLELMAQGKDSLEAMEEVLQISPFALERQWKDTIGPA